MSDEAKPAGFPNTDTDEAETQRVLLDVIHPDRIKLEFETRDKYPNRDGFIEITDENEIPIGDIVIQVKKLNKKYTNPAKFPADVRTLMYAKAISPPLLILGVDVDQEQVYWKHISKDWLDENEDDLNEQETKTIYFSEEHALDGESRDYISEWQTIAVENKRKIWDYEEFKRLKETATPALGKERSRYSRIHRFLDEYNRLRSEEFEVVQRREANDVWVYGYIDSCFENDQLIYGLYPIPSTVNDVQIKELDPDELFEMNSHGVVRATRHAGNPIKSSPERLAKFEIKNDVTKVIDNQNFDLSNSEFLIREVVFDFVDEYNELMGLEIEDMYTTDELYVGFFYYLQNWLDTAISSFAKANFQEFVSYGNYLNPMSVSGRLRQEKIQEIHDNLDGTEGEVGYLYPVGTHRYSPEVLVEVFNKVPALGESIERPYLEEDERPADQDSWSPWEGYSVENLFENIKRVWLNLPTSYQSLLRANFSAIQDDLAYYDMYSKIFIQVENLRSEQRPSERRLFLSTESGDGKPDIEVSTADEAPDMINDLTPGEEIEIDNERYTVEKYSVGRPVFFGDKPPVLSELCSRLKDQIDEYFSDVTTSQGLLIPNPAAQSSDDDGDVEN